jgi:tRNA (pseudouridine54-N1)-methyltransferase
VQLHEDGTPAGETDPPEDATFVLSDHRAFTDDEQVVLEAVADRRVSLGPLALHADQAMVVANNWLDTEGFESY